MARKRGNGTAGPKAGDIRELTQIQKGMLKEADRKITLRSDGHAEEATLADVVTRKMFQVAANGSPHALGHVWRALNEAQTLRQALVDEKVERGKLVKQRLQERLAQAVRDGADPVWIVPHPDDIVITEDEGWDVKGPVDEEGLRSIRERIAMRSVLLLQSILDERLSDRSQSRVSDVPTEEMAGSTSLMFAHLLNDKLPERFRLSIVGMTLEIMRYERLTKRELLKVTRAAWAAIGRPVPRGKVVPPWCEAGPRVERTIRGLMDVLDQIRTGTLTTERGIAERLTEVLRR